MAAGVLIVEEAGGRVTDYAGRPIRMVTGQIVASNGPLHGAILDTIRTAEQ